MATATAKKGDLGNFSSPLYNLPKLKIGKLEALLPIVQGGMGVGVSLSGLASAVAIEGGIGIIATAGIGVCEPDFETDFKGTYERGLRNEIKKALDKDQRHYRRKHNDGSF